MIRVITMTYDEGEYPLRRHQERNYCDKNHCYPIITMVIIISLIIIIVPIMILSILSIISITTTIVNIHKHPQNTC